MSQRFPLTTIRSHLSLTFLGATLALVGCASNGRDAIPANARVEVLQTGSLVMRGTADATPGSATCATAPLPAKHVLELLEETTGAIKLRAIGAHDVTVLHVTNLETNKTWCVMTKGDGAEVTIPGDFAAGLYAISVAESNTFKPDPYEVVFEKM